VGGAENLTFEYLNFATGAVVVGNIDYITVDGIAGDYNDDGTVNAADYVIWRKNENTNNTLPNDPIGGTIDGDQYTQWRANFGETGGNGAANGAHAVPEPGSWLLASLAIAALFSRRAMFAASEMA
jgi:hypothetical protein